MTNKHRLHSQQLTPALIVLMSIACGVIVANLYYIQPLLEQVSHFFGVSESQAGLLSTLTQAGYALGVFLILPFADTVEKKKLIVTMVFTSVIALLLMYVAKSYVFACFVALAIGITSITPQLLLPLAAQMSAPERRGEVLGRILAGLLTGILLSRVLSGFIGEKFGWQSVYLIGAILVSLLGILLFKLLPKAHPIENISYKQALASLVSIIMGSAVLRRVSIIGAMTFAALNIFWTSLTFLLASPHYNMGSNVAGLFGLVGLVGILASSFVGKFSDSKGSKFVTGIGISILVISYLCLILFGYHFIGLVLGVILIDLGVQSCNVSGQAMIHQLHEGARNRITAIYMGTSFVGGALGSYFGALGYAHWGWIGVCVIALATQAVSIAVFFGIKEVRSH